MSKKKVQHKRYAWKPSNQLRFGLLPTVWDPVSKSVTNAKCQFCSTFGQSWTLKKKSTSSATTCTMAATSSPTVTPPPRKKRRYRSGNETMKVFTSFRTDAIIRHLQRCHAKKWDEYNLLSDEEKINFFATKKKDDITPLRQTPLTQTALSAYMPRREQPFIGYVSKTIVRDILLALYFRKEDEPRYATLEKDVFCDDSEEDADLPRFQIKIARKARFKLAMNFISAGLSFNQAAKCLNHAKNASGMAVFQGATPDTVSRMAAKLLALSLENIKLKLAECWAFSIAFDPSKHESVNYNDIRVRIALKGGAMKNYHLLAVPSWSTYTGKKLHDQIVHIMTVLCPDWTKKIVGISTDGERKMTGRISGAQTLLQKTLAEKGSQVVHIWCGLHQLDLVVKKAYRSFFEGKWLSSLNKLLSFLQRQHNLIMEMGGKAKKFADTRWLSMSQCSSWLLKPQHKSRIQTYLNQRDTSQALDATPYDDWWLQSIFINHVAEKCGAVFSELQGLDQNLFHQDERLESLATYFKDLGSIIGPLSAAQLEEYKDEDKYCIVDTFVISFDNMKKAIENSGGFDVIAALDAMDETDRDKYIAAAAKFLVGLVAGISSINSTRNESNMGIDVKLPILPAHFAAYSAREFASAIAFFADRFAATRGQAKLVQLKKSFMDFKELFLSNATTFRTLVNARYDNIDSVNLLHSYWNPVCALGRANGKDFETLWEYASGLATIFPNTATVESDFSVVKGEMDDTRTLLTSVSLEGILHSKDFPIDML